MTAPYFQIGAGAETKQLDFPAGSSEIVIGRSSDCQLVIASGQVSRRHARVLWRDGEATIEDLGSANGTFVNGRRLSQATALKPNDRVSLGTVDLTFVLPEPEGTATVVAPPPSPPAATVQLSPTPAPEPVVERPPTAVAVPKAVEHTTARPAPRYPPSRPSPASVSGPSVIELVMIALGSFLAVFAIGAALIRLVF